MFEEFKNAFNRPNNGLVQLIIINVAIFLSLLAIDLITWALGAGIIFDKVYDQFSIPPSLEAFILHPWTLITYMFTHSMQDIFHILFNMLALYWFGKLFVEYLGSDKLIALYVLGGIVGGLAFLALHYFAPGFVGERSMVGASGAIYAIVVATAVLLPNYTFFLFLFGPVKIKYIAAFYVLISLISVRQGVNIGGNIAHLGGTLMGFIYIKQLQAGINWGGWITWVIEWVKGLFKRGSKVKVSYRKNEQGANGKKVSVNASGISQKEIDEILDKISDGGYESLTKEEKEKLFKASKK